MRRPHTVALISAFGIIVTLSSSGCTDTGSVPGPTENLTLSISSSHTHSSLASPGHQTLAISSAKVLIRDVRFKEEVSGDGTDVKSSSFVVFFAVDGSVTPVARARIRPGIYEILQFTLHKPEDQESLGDPDFGNGPSDDQRYSVIVTGFYHETPFVYRSQVNARQDLRLPLPIEVPSEGYVNVTLKIDPYAWFTVGELVLDPFIQGKEIDDRIVSSFANAFRDNDGNGEPD